MDRFAASAERRSTISVMYLFGRHSLAGRTRGDAPAG
jgi:hypothetical protein